MGMSVGGGGEGSVMAEINVTPLVDVMLVLLIIFMITAPLMSHKVQVDLPLATAEKNDADLKTITIALTENGDIFWNDKPITREAFFAQLRVEARREPQPTVQLRADRTTTWEDAGKLFSLAKNAGMKSVRVVTTPQR
jgi:biopolymer transport protein ExbD